MNSRTLFSIAMALCLSAAAGFVAPGHAKGYKLKTIYTFCSEEDCVDGQIPLSLILDPSGRVIYGTTQGGGAEGRGTVFTLTRTKTGKWKHKVLHEFTCDGNCPGGWRPGEGRLIRDDAGNIYGTTQQGGVAGFGGVYELAKTGKTWQFKAIIDFCKLEHCADGGTSARLTYAGESTGALYDGVSPLFGMGPSDSTLDQGIFYSLTNNGGTWSKDTLYALIDGRSSEVTMDGAGNVFGIAAHQQGSPFLIELSQPAGVWKAVAESGLDGGSRANTALLPTGTGYILARPALVETMAKGQYFAGTALIFRLLTISVLSKTVRTDLIHSEA